MECSEDNDFLQARVTRLEEMVTELVEQLTEKQVLSVSNSCASVYDSAELDKARWGAFEEMLREEEQARRKLEAKLDQTFSVLPSCAALALSVKAEEKPPSSAKLPAFAEAATEAFAVLAAELKAEMERQHEEWASKLQDWVKERQVKPREAFQRDLSQMHPRLVTAMTPRDSLPSPVIPITTTYLVEAPSPAVSTPRSMTAPGMGQSWQAPLTPRSVTSVGVMKAPVASWYGPSQLRHSLGSKVSGA